MLLAGHCIPRKYLWDLTAVRACYIRKNNQNILPLLGEKKKNPNKYTPEFGLELVKK